MIGVCGGGGRNGFVEGTLRGGHENACLLRTRMTERVAPPLDVSCPSLPPHPMPVDPEMALQQIRLAPLGPVSLSAQSSLFLRGRFMQLGSAPMSPASDTIHPLQPPINVHLARLCRPTTVGLRNLLDYPCPISSTSLHLACGRKPGRGTHPPSCEAICDRCGSG